MAPFILLGLLIINRHLISKKIVAGMVFIGIGMAALSYHAVASRVDLALNEVSQFNEKNNANTSTGIRLELWKSGVYAFASEPVFGIGYQNRHSFKQALVDNNLVNPIVLQFRRLHNSYIEELSIKGLIGFAALMLFFLVPIYFFLRRGNIKYNVFTQLGVAHITLVMGYCLTQNYINHHSGMLQYLMFVIIFYAMLYNENSTLSPEQIKAKQ